MGAVITGKSKDMEQESAVTINLNYYVETNGLAEFKFKIVAVKLTVKFSEALFVLEYQLIIIEIESKLKNVVLPETDPVTYKVYTISLAVQIESDDDTVDVAIAYEPAA